MLIIVPADSNKFEYIKFVFGKYLKIFSNLRIETEYCIVDLKDVDDVFQFAP